MASAQEAAAAGNRSIQAVLDAGVDEIAKNEVITFNEYTKYVLSPDGSVFWIANGNSMKAKGSLHIAADSLQLEDETIGIAQTIFTSEELVNEFVNIAPTKLWIGAWPMEGVTLKIAFASRGRFYEQAQLFHYSGHAVYPAMQTQIIDSMADLPTGPIVSNSLPIWLALGINAGVTVPIYPSFLVPDNILPPYVVVHIEANSTHTLQNAPIYAIPGTPSPVPGFISYSSSQLMRDEVKLTLYGFTAQAAQQFYAAIEQYSMVGFGETPTFGFANSPVMTDEKRMQAEITAIAQKKKMVISANYYLNVANAIAYRLILSALPPTITINPHPGT
jgi:hypothetical protein